MEGGSRGTRVTTEAGWQENGVYANDGAERARLGLSLHSPLGVGCGRLDPSQGLRVLSLGHGGVASK